MGLDFYKGALMTEDARTPGLATWNVVFLSGNRSSWWDLLTDPDFRHVCAFTYSTTTNTWIIYDVADTHSAIACLDDLWFDRWLRARQPRITSALQVKVGDRGSVRSRFGMWCTTAIKHLVAIPSGALRPQALHRDLVKSGATEVFKELYVRQGEGTEGRSGDSSAASAG